MSPAASRCCPELPQDIARRRRSASRSSPAKPRKADSTRCCSDAWNGKLAPLYNYMDKLPSLTGEPPPFLPRQHVRRTSGSLSSIDLGRGCPYQCSFCTIINVQGRKSRFRSPDDLERIVRENYAQGIKRFFITDDNFARNQRLGDPVRPADPAARRRLPEDRLHHPGRHAVPQDPELHREGGAGRRAARLHRAREHQPGQSDRRQEAAEQDHRIPRDAAEVARPRRHHLRRLHPRLSRRHQGIDHPRHRASSSASCRSTSWSSSS